MKSDEAMAAESAVEAKLAEVGADRMRVPTGGFDTPTEEYQPTVPEPPTEEPAPLVEDAPPAPEPVAEQGDPVAAAVLAKYGNDPAKVAQAYAELQKKLGQQGTELGQTRQENTEMAQLLQEMSQIREAVTQPQRNQFVDQSTSDAFDQLVMENPQQALEWARQNNNDLLYRRGISTWKEVDPYGAARYENALDMQALEQRFQQQYPTNESVEMQGALMQVLAEHQEYGQYGQAELQAMIEKYPVVAAGLTGNQQQKKQTIEVLFALAQGDTLRSLAFNQTTQEPSTEVQVVTPTVSDEHPDEEAKPVSGVDEFRRQFAEEAQRYNGERAIPGAFVAR